MLDNLIGDLRTLIATTAKARQNAWAEVATITKACDARIAAINADLAQVPAQRRAYVISGDWTAFDALHHAEDAAQLAIARERLAKAKLVEAKAAEIAALLAEFAPKATALANAARAIVNKGGNTGNAVFDIDRLETEANNLAFGGASVAVNVQSAQNALDAVIAAIVHGSAV